MDHHRQGTTLYGKFMVLSPSGMWLSPMQHVKIELDVDLGVKCSSTVIVDHYIHPDRMRHRWLRSATRQQCQRSCCSRARSAKTGAFVEHFGVVCVISVGVGCLCQASRFSVAGH